MTERAYVQMMREEVDLNYIRSLPYVERHIGGYTVNTGRENIATRAIENHQDSKNYRVEVFAVNDDGIRYQAIINAGRDNGIGVDGLSERMDKDGLSLSEMIEKYTFGEVKTDEIAFYQLEFYREHHR